MDDYARYLLEARRRFRVSKAATIKELQKAYIGAANLIRIDIESTTDGTLRKSHLNALARALEERAKQLEDQVMQLIFQGIWIGIESGSFAPQKIATTLLAGTFPALEIEQLFAGINERAVTALLSRTLRDGLNVSDRVWKISANYRNALTRIVEDGVARGLDSRKLAVEVQRYAVPDKWSVHKVEVRRRVGIPKNVSYEAMRLARTEMNNAFHEGMINANQSAPGYQGIYWRLSEAHPAPDVCDNMASSRLYGAPGFYPKEKEPTRPHPQ